MCYYSLANDDSSASEEMTPCVTVVMGGFNSSRFRLGKLRMGVEYNLLPSDL